MAEKEATEGYFKLAGMKTSRTASLNWFSLWKSNDVCHAWLMREIETSCICCSSYEQHNCSELTQLHASVYQNENLHQLSVTLRLDNEQTYKRTLEAVKTGSKSHDIQGV